MKIIGWLVLIFLFVYAYVINRNIGVNIVSPIFVTIFPWVGGAFLIFLIGSWIRLKLNETAPGRERERLVRENAERVVKEQQEYDRKIAKDAQIMQYQQLRKEIEATSKYQDWRNEVFLKYGRKCQKCNKTENLELHHRQSFRSIIQTYKIKNIFQALICDVLWDPNNGLVLCKECHEKEPSSIYRASKL